MLHLFNERDDNHDMVFGGNNESHFHQKYNISLLPVIPINGSHIADTKVTPPEDGPSQPRKAIRVTRCPEEELG